LTRALFASFTWLLLFLPASSLSARITENPKMEFRPGTFNQNKPKTLFKSNRCTVQEVSMSGEYVVAGSVGIITIRQGSMDFRISRKVPTRSDFYINSNFFTNQRPIGEVVIDGRQVNKKVNRGGYFYVKNGKANIRKTRPQGVDYACQSIMMGIQNGAINTYITRTRTSQEKTWRGMLGVNKNGDVVVVHSKTQGLISMLQLCEISKKAGIINGIVLDGGSSLQVLLHDKGYFYEYQPVPDLVKKVAGIHKPFVFVAGTFR
jgi:hypothetical protein